MKKPQMLGHPAKLPALQHIGNFSSDWGKEPQMQFCLISFTNNKHLFDHWLGYLFVLLLFCLVQVSSGKYRAFNPLRSASLSRYSASYRNHLYYLLYLLMGFDTFAFWLQLQPALIFWKHWLNYSPSNFQDQADILKNTHCNLILLYYINPFETLVQQII